MASVSAVSHLGLAISYGINLNRERKEGDGVKPLSANAAEDISGF